MKTILQLTIILLGCSKIWATTSCTQITVQAIYASKEEPYRRAWGANEYRILDVPFLDCRLHGHPPYEAITQSHPILHNGREGVVECNLLFLLGIRIDYGEAVSPSVVRLNVEGFKKVEGITTMIEEAVDIALECIRLVENRYRAKVGVIIISPDASVSKWKAVERRFNGHDLAKPFIKQTSGQQPAEQGDGQPAPRSEAK